MSGYSSGYKNIVGRDTSNRNYENESRKPFTKINFPEGVRIKKIDSHCSRNCYAIDHDGGLWIWGSKFYDRYCNEYGEEEGENE